MHHTTLRLQVSYHSCVCNNLARVSGLFSMYNNPVRLNSKSASDWVYIDTYALLIFQDGRIDYNEFVAMMHKGNADLGKKRLPNNFSIGYREPMVACWQGRI